MHCQPALNLAAPDRPRVLLIAEGCNPNLTSVPLVGFFHARAIAQWARALVVTHIRNRADLVAAEETSNLYKNQFGRLMVAANYGSPRSE